MLFYFSIWLFLFIVAFVEICCRLNKQNSLQLFFFSSFFLFILSFIRWETGTDWEGYFEYFNHITGYFQETNYEFAYARINEFAKLTFDSYTILLLMLSGILFFFQTKIIYQHSYYPLFSLLFLWSISFANVFYIRQSIATIILLNSVFFLVKKEYIKFILCVILASLFHISSCLFVLAYFVVKIKWSYKKMCFCLLFAVCLSSVLSLIITNVMPLFHDIIQYKLETYMELGENGEAMGSSSLKGILIRGIANKVFILLILMFFAPKELRENNLFKVLLNLYWFGAIIYFITISISVVFVRFSFPYDIIQIILLPMLLRYVPYKRRIMFFGGLSIFLLLRFYVSLFGSYYDLYVPYRTIFDV